MGNSVASFKEGLAPGARDRMVNRISATEPSYYWVGTHPTNLPSYSAGSSSRCVDYNHPYYYSSRRFLDRMNSMRKDGRRINVDMGHPFAKESVTLTMPSVVNVVVPVDKTLNKGFYGVYAPTVNYGTAMRNIAAGKFPGLPEGLGVDRAYLWSLGSTAIAKSIPDVPEFSLFRFIGELKGGLPKIPMQLLAKEKKLRNAGGEYLNVQFGILPLVSDLQNFLEALQNPALRSAVKHQLHEENRVRKVIDKGSTSTTVSTPSAQLVTATNQTQQTGYATTVKKYRIWSSCSFAYYQVVALDQLLSELDIRLGGLGAVPSAIDIWNLLPWSWLVDWFMNINHVITNLSYLGKDGLYLQRGYIMGHYTEEIKSFQTGLIFGKRCSTTGVQTFDRKYRVRASPFGFGYTWKDFDPFQLSILGALGVSRLRF
jgi:hypothetical protein